MISRRRREPPPQKAEPTPFAAKAKDLGALRDAVVDAAGVGAGLWLSYLFVLFYFAIAAGAVMHRDLLLENSVKLPFLNVELPLKAFFILAPLVFLIVHLYVLLHFVLLAAKVGAFNTELETQIAGDDLRTRDVRARLRRQLPSNIFVQFIAGPREVRTGTVGFLLRQVAQISLVAGPIALLVLFQLQFLPYHSPSITWWQRIALVLDLLLLWFLWPPIARGETSLLTWRDFKRVKVLAWMLASTLPVLLVCTVATFPGEWLEDHIPTFLIVPTQWPEWSPEKAQAEESAPQNQSPQTISKDQSLLTELKVRTAAVLESLKLTSMHKLLVAGEVNYITVKPNSLWSNVLVLPNFEIGDRAKFDAEGKIAISSDALSLRGRAFEGAVLVNARLRKADFTGARLASAHFFQADLREAKFGCDWIGDITLEIVESEKNLMCAQLQGANFEFALLQGASFVGAQLQGANLSFSKLQGADLSQAQLQGADLSQAQLWGAKLAEAELQGAYLEQAELLGAVLDNAELLGAWLSNAQLQGASLDDAQLQGASLDDAQLQGAVLNQPNLDGASLRRDYVWRTDPPSNMKGAFVDEPEGRPIYSGVHCSGHECVWLETSYAALTSQIENSVPVGRREQALQQIATLKPPDDEEEGSGKAWTDLASESVRSAGSYFNTLAKMLKELGCAADGAPYVIGSLTWQLDDRFKRNPSQKEEAEVAAAFLDEANCPGARGLPERNKAKLQQIRDEAPAPPSPAQRRHSHRARSKHLTQSTGRHREPTAPARASATVSSR